MKTAMDLTQQSREATSTRSYGGFQAGLTLIELIIAMVVISVALVGVLSVINYTTRHSADPVLRHQAIAIAEAYMEEITLKNYSDPGGPSESGRADFDDVMDYTNLTDTGARNHNNDLILGLEGYDITVTVEDVADWNGVEAKKITVTVTSPANEDISLTGYRTDN